MPNFSQCLRHILQTGQRTKDTYNKPVNGQRKYQRYISYQNTKGTYQSSQWTNDWYIKPINWLEIKRPSQLTKMEHTYQTSLWTWTDIWKIEPVKWQWAEAVKRKQKDQTDQRRTERSNRSTTINRHITPVNDHDSLSTNQCIIPNQSVTVFRAGSGNRTRPDRVQWGPRIKTNTKPMPKSKQSEN